MGQGSTQIVIRGERPLYKRGKFRVMEAMPKLWIACVGVRTVVNSLCVRKLLRKYERWLFVTGTNRTCGESKTDHNPWKRLAIKHGSPPFLRETLSILREPL